MQNFILFLFLFLFLTKCLADSNDTFNVIVGEVAQYESNLFRLSNGLTPTGQGTKRWDNVLRTNLGFQINKTYSLQTFKIEYSLMDNRYENASYLNFLANTYKTAWLWSLTPQLKGNISASSNSSLQQFQDYRNTNTRNVRVNDIRSADFDWSAYNNWHIIGGYTMLDSKNTSSFLPETSFILNGLNTGLKYVFLSESYINFKVTGNDATNQSANFANFIGNGYTEILEELSGLWLISGKSTLYSSIGYNDHSDKTFSVRSFSGFSGDINYTWQYTADSKLNIDLNRQLSPFQTAYNSYTELDSLTIRPEWTITPTVSLRLNGLISTRNYLGDGPITQFSRVDHSLSGGMSLNWAPRSNIGLGLTMQYTDRQTNATNGSYNDLLANINGKIGF